MYFLPKKMPKKLEKLVNQLIKDGVSSDNAWGIATNMLQKAGILERNGQKVTRKGRQKRYGSKKP